MPPIVAQGRRPGPVVVYSPGRYVPQLGPQRQAPAPTRRTNANQQQPTGNASAELFAAGAQQQAQQQQKQAAQQAYNQSFWGHGIGAAIGTVIKPLAFLSPPMKAILAGREAVATHTSPGAQSLLDAIIGGGVNAVQTNFLQSIPKTNDPAEATRLGINVPLNPVLNPLRSVDVQKANTDQRSFAQKIAPHSTFGSLELQKDTGNRFVNNLYGFMGDIAADPLTYVGGGATYVPKGLEGTEAAAQGSRIALGGHTAAERIEFLGRAVEADPSLAQRFGQDIQTGIQKGLTRMSPEARDAFGEISKPGMFVRGTPYRIPFSGIPGEALARAGSATRTALSNIPGEAGTKLGALRNVRVPVGLEEPYGILARGAEGDPTRALLTYTNRQGLHLETGAAEALGNRRLSQFVKSNIKGLGKGQIRQALVEAETSTKPNFINDLFAKILKGYETISGRSVDPDYLRNPNTYVPHIITPGFRRVLKAAIAGGDENALKFARLNGFTSDDLLESSGFLAEARQLTTDGGAPKVVMFGDHPVTIADDTINGLNHNEDLRALFPGYKGKFFMDDPVQIGEAYSSSLARQAGRDATLSKLVGSASAFGLGGRVEGPLAEAFQASQEARANIDPRLAQIRAGFEPGGTVAEAAARPVVPGSAEDIANRNAYSTWQTQAEQLRTQATEHQQIIDAAATKAGTPTTPSPLWQQLDEHLTASPPPPRPAYEAAGIKPEDYFVGKESGPLTQERNDLVMKQGKEMVNAINKEAETVQTKARSFLSGIRKSLMTGLGKSLKEDAPRIKLLDERIANSTKRIGELNMQRPLDQEELINHIQGIRQAGDDLKTELAAVNKTWDAKNTRTTKQVVKKMESQLRQLEKLHADAVEVMQTMPARMRAEAASRLEELRAPIQRATEAHQAAIDAVPGKVSDEAFNAAQGVIRTNAKNTAEYDELVGDWKAAHDNLQEAIANAPRKNGKLTPESQRMVDEAARREHEARVRLRLGDQQAKTVSPLQEARTEIKQIEEQLATGRKSGTAPVEDYSVFVEDPPTAGPAYGPVDPAAMNVRQQMEANGFVYQPTVGWISDEGIRISKQVKPHILDREGVQWDKLQELIDQGRRIEQVSPTRAVETYWQLSIPQTHSTYHADSVAEAFDKAQEVRGQLVAEARAAELKAATRTPTGQFRRDVRLPPPGAKRSMTAVEAEAASGRSPLLHVGDEDYDLMNQVIERQKYLRSRADAGLQTPADLQEGGALGDLLDRIQLGTRTAPQPGELQAVENRLEHLSRTPWNELPPDLQDEYARLMFRHERLTDVGDISHAPMTNEEIAQAIANLPIGGGQATGPRAIAEDVWTQFMDAPPDDNFVGPVRSNAEYAAYRRFLADTMDDPNILQMRNQEVRRLIQENYPDLPQEFQDFFDLRRTKTGESPAAAQVTARSARRRAAQNVEKSVEDAAADVGGAKIGELTPDVLTNAERGKLQRRLRYLNEQIKTGRLAEERKAFETISNRFAWEKDVANDPGVAAAKKNLDFERAKAAQQPEAMIFRSTETPEVSMQRVYPQARVEPTKENVLASQGLTQERTTAETLQAKIDEVSARLVNSVRGPDRDYLMNQLAIAQRRLGELRSGERVGFGVGEERLPIQVTTPPQRESFEDVIRDPTTNQIIGAPPAPRTETEAITSLKFAAEHPFGGGSASQLMHTAETPGGVYVNPVDEYQQRINATYEILADPKKEAARINQAARDEAISSIQNDLNAQALGHSMDAVQLRKNLNAIDDETLAMQYRVQEDVKELTPLKQKRESLTAMRDQVKAADPGRYALDLNGTLSDISEVAKANPQMLDRDLNVVESLLDQHGDNLARVTKNRTTAKEVQSMINRPDKLAAMTTTVLNDQWRLLRNGPLAPGAEFLDKELYRMFTNVYKLNAEPTLFGRVFNAMTNIWKTYATLSPGFHVRNALSGIFMNTADGVPLLTQLEGALTWRKFVKAEDPEAWLAAQPARIQQAFHAAGGSGAGGRFLEAGFAQAGSNRDWLNAVMANKVTRWSQRVGSNVEGSLRMGMALDSIDRGEGMAAAMGRIAKIHFDYSQVSQLDKKMKQIIPFWTFLSRNLPLQVEMMWTKPGLYRKYDILQNNFQAPPDPFTPDYWNRLGSWNTGYNNPLTGNSIYIQPDFGFNQVQPMAQDVADFVSMKRPGALLSQVNPLIGAPLDYVMKRDSFYNRNYTPSDYRKQTGAAALPINLLGKTPLGSALGITNAQGEVSDNFWNMYTSLNPIADRAQRLFPGEGGDPARQAESWARFLGLPPFVRSLSPSLQRSEAYRQRQEAQAQLDAQQAALRRLLQSQAS